MVSMIERPEVGLRPNFVKSFIHVVRRKDDRCGRPGYTDAQLLEAIREEQALLTRQFDLLEAYAKRLQLSGSRPSFR